MGKVAYIIRIQSRYSSVVFLETTGPIEAKFHTWSKHPIDEITIDYSVYGPGHMTKMAALQMLSKNSTNTHTESKGFYLLYITSGMLALQSFFK